MKTITLLWHGPFSFREILTEQGIKNEYSVPGVYIWTETLPKGSRQISYVGKATKSTTLWRRHLQHYSALIGGIYNIPKEFCSWGSAWVPDKQKRETVEMVLDRERFKEVVDAGFNRAAATEIYFCRLSENEPGLVKIERQLLYELKPTGTKRGTISPTKNSFSIIHENTPWKV